MQWVYVFANSFLSVMTPYLILNGNEERVRTLYLHFVVPVSHRILHKHSVFSWCSHDDRIAVQFELITFVGLQ